MWKSSVDIESEIEKIRNLDDLYELYSLRVLWKNAIYSKEYNADPVWKEILAFTPHGKELLNILVTEHRCEDTPDFYLAFFCRFYHHDLFIDHESSKIAEVKNLLEKELFQEKIRFPFRFGRELYDRFNDIDQSNRTDHLPADKVSNLLEGTPQGIYQVGYKVVGPLGVFDSEEPRAIYPSHQLPLWHCSDTGCNAIHLVRVEQYKNMVINSCKILKMKLDDLYGPQSEWEWVLKWMYRKGKWENGKPYYDICELISSGIFGEERTLLTEAVLAGEFKSKLREILSKSPGNRISIQASASDIAFNLNPEQQLQLLFYLPDRYLVETIDSLVFKDKIQIPIGEERSPDFSARGRVKDRHVCLSSRGIRSEIEDPVNGFISLLIEGYEKAGIRNELEWRLRKYGGESTWQSLFDFFESNSPDRIVEELMLSSSSVTRHICESVWLSLDHINNKNEIANNRILWKLGFNPTQYDSSLIRINDKLREFNEMLYSLTPTLGEEERQKIRSVGVNLFVYLEDFLERFISYNVWMLSADHFVEDGFCFDIVKARELVPKILGDKISTGGVTFSWSVAGGNTLGVLLVYLSASMEWMLSLPDADRDDFERQDCDLPHFVNDKSNPFPFRHVRLWADSIPEELERYVNKYVSISKLILQANIAEIRNGIDHHRDEKNFPEIDRMLACASRVHEAIDSADVNRFYPKYFWLSSRESSRFEVIKYTYIDYSKRELVVSGPPAASGLPRKRYRHPVLIAPYNLLGLPNSQLIFRVKDTSLYTKYWEGYPRRRHITTKVDAGTEVGDGSVNGG